MLFILQKEKAHIDNSEVFALKEILDHQKYVHTYQFATLASLQEKNPAWQEAVPVGSIQFVQQFLLTYHGISHMQPIEVPPILRLERFLKRRYEILPKTKLPASGYYFTKYVSDLKTFYHTGTPAMLRRDVGKLPEGLYQVAEVIDIEAEYRCFILQDEIIGVQFYNGDCTIFPTKEDVALLKEMVLRYSVDKTRPQAYTLDIALIKDRGLAIIECHPHTSVGLYGLYGNFLPYCYKYGFDWYVQHNTPIEPFSTEAE